MPYRKTIFTNDEIYHVLNRSVAQIPIFNNLKEHQRFLELIDFYRYFSTLSFSHYVRLSLKEKEKFKRNLENTGKLVEIFAHCLMPNHFHLLLKQLKTGGVSMMLANLQNSFARYFNLKNERAGALFQSMFRAIRIETDEQLLHVSRYIHLNPSSSYLVEIKNLTEYPWSSLPEYLGKSPSLFTNTKFILDIIGDKEKYKEFILNQAEYQCELNKIKHLVLETP